MTLRQSAFCDAYMETGNASEAYRRAYNAENTKPESLWVAAHRVLNNAKVKARIDELRAKLAAKAEITREDLLRELEEARAIGAQSQRPSAMVAATMGKAKLLGFDDGNSQPLSGQITLKIGRAGGHKP